MPRDSWPDSIIAHSNLFQGHIFDANPVTRPMCTPLAPAEMCLLRYKGTSIRSKEIWKILPPGSWAVFSRTIRTRTVFPQQLLASPTEYRRNAPTQEYCIMSAHRRDCLGLSPSGENRCDQPPKHKNTCSWPIRNKLFSSAGRCLSLL